MKKIYLGISLLALILFQGCTLDSGDLTSSPVTSGTTLVKATTQNYVEKNQTMLVEEASQGKGRHLEALAHLMGCSEESYQDVSTMIHRNFQKFMKEAPFSSQGFLHRLEQAIQSNPALRKSCRRLG